MKHHPRYAAVLAVMSMAAAAQAQEKLDQFNPVDHAVISQTIAPDARSAGMSE